ncbi:synaptonemal complex protein 3-like [Dipodomys merriami]|uniref:synaptonemal complex protein 3-like n=1 Tax=Dipodomys merriami TaxID=94247 RepID=UPI003855A8AD
MKPRARKHHRLTGQVARHEHQDVTSNPSNQQDVTLSQHDQQEVTPNRHNQQEMTPNLHDQQEVTPNHHDQQEEKPNGHDSANNPVIHIGENTHVLSEAEASEGAELQDMFQKLQEDIMKLLATKRRNVKVKVNTSFKAIQEKLDELLKSHQERRERIYEEYALEFAAFVNASGEDMARIKAEADKLAAIFREQQLTFQQYVIAHNQEMEAFQKICQCHFKNLNDLENFHEDELNTENNTLQENMSSM